MVLLQRSSVSRLRWHGWQRSWVRKQQGLTNTSAHLDPASHFPPLKTSQTDNQTPSHSFSIIFTLRLGPPSPCFVFHTIRHLVNPYLLHFFIPHSTTLPIPPKRDGTAHCTLHGHLALYFKNKTKTSMIKPNKYLFFLLSIFKFNK